jgi:hypothetical protein
VKSETKILKMAKISNENEVPKEEANEKALDSKKDLNVTIM